MRSIERKAPIESSVDVLTCIELVTQLCIDSVTCVSTIHEASYWQPVTSLTRQINKPTNFQIKFCPLTPSLLYSLHTNLLCVH